MFKHNKKNSNDNKNKNKKNGINNIDELSELFIGMDIDNNINKIKKILEAYNISYNLSELNLGANANTIQFKVDTHNKSEQEENKIRESMALLENNGYNVKQLRNAYVIYPNMPTDTYTFKKKRKYTRKPKKTKSILLKSFF